MSVEPSSPAPAPAIPPAAIRWSWEAYPANRIDGTRVVVPLGCLYTPLDPAGCVNVAYPPLRCSGCTGALNSFCAIDFRSKTWGCPLCSVRNAFPPHYAAIAENSLPAELVGYNTVDYCVKQGLPGPVFVFVVDTCVDTAEELTNLKDCLRLSIDRLPEYAAIALITYGTTVQVHEINGTTDFPRSIVFRGSSEVTTEHIKKGLKHPEKFFGLMSQCEFSVASIIDDLQLDCWPVAKEHRPMRCTGAALSAAASLLEIVAPQSSGHVVAFVSGVCTEGPGQVVVLPKESMIRTHHDIQDKTAAAGLFPAAQNFYDSLMRRMVGLGHPLHVVAACLDQWGAAEMKTAIQATGGVVLATDSWKREPLRISLRQFFKRHPDGTLAMGTNVTTEVVTSPSWKVTGAIAQCIGTGKRSGCIADSEIGYGGTCQWATCFLDAKSTFAFYFETSNTPPASTTNQPATGASAGSTNTSKGQPQFRYVQFITKYFATGAERIRVTTVRHLVQDPTNFPALAQYFDQEAASVLMSRIAAHKTDTQPVIDVLRWLDRIVIRLVSRFGDYTKDQPLTLKLNPRFANFPVFMFHLRRSAYMQVFNSSPDETAILRLLLLRADSSDSIVMIHPALYSYSMQAPPTPVPLDVSCSQPDNVLLLDTFFEVLIHHGPTIAAWRQAGYETHPDFAHFKAFLDSVREQAKSIAADRYPAPRLLEVGPLDGDARILMNRINPSRTHNNQAGAAGAYGGAPGELVYTDDASLQTFMDHLKRLAVQQQ